MGQGRHSAALAAHLGDLSQGIFVLVAFDAQAGEAGGDVLQQTPGNRHGSLLFEGNGDGEFLPRSRIGRAG
jgi:hypothetical protein